MAKAPHYTGDNVKLTFTVFDARAELEPTSGTAQIQKPDETILDPETATIEGNKVTYIVPTTVTDSAGSYSCYFELTLPGNYIRTHKIAFNILENIGS